jgi:hypothetical protein
MKTAILLLCLLCGLGVAAQAPEGIIGINTVNPKGVLHIDGAANNPSAGNISAAEAADDVVIDAARRMGVGLRVSDVKAKLDISSSTPGAIRIEDGTEGAGRLFFSDADGIGRWMPLAIGSWVAALYNHDDNNRFLGFSTDQSVRTFTNYDDSLFVSTGMGSLSKAAGSITIPPEPGRYRVTLTICWTADNSNSRTAPYKTRAILYAGSSEKETFDFWGGGTLNNSPAIAYTTQPTFISILDLDGGETLTIATDERENRANNARAVLFMVELLL